MYNLTALSSKAFVLLQATYLLVKPHISFCTFISRGSRGCQKSFWRYLCVPNKPFNHFRFLEVLKNSHCSWFWLCVPNWYFFFAIANGFHCVFQIGICYHFHFLRTLRNLIGDSWWFWLCVPNRYFILLSLSRGSQKSFWW